MKVLDAGGGLGGPARTLASEFGCRVTVLDLTEEYCRAGAMLTARCGLSERVTFQHGDALALPFAPESFDMVMDAAQLVARARLAVAGATAVGAGRARWAGVLPRPQR